MNYYILISLIKYIFYYIRYRNIVIVCNIFLYSNVLFFIGYYRENLYSIIKFFKVLFNFVLKFSDRVMKLSFKDCT